VPGAGGGQTHRRCFDELRAAGIGVNLHYIPVNRQPYYERLGDAETCDEADRYYAEAISLPMFPAMTDEQHARVIAGVRAVCAP
jgi:dTDP-4-amino-4,6-dideoxygalactose transaminase